MRIRTHHSIRALVGFGCLAMSAPLALAQTSTQLPQSIAQIPKLDPPRTAADSAAVLKAAAIADTGRMTPGYRDISRYDTPGYCVAAIIGLGQETWRSHERDTLAVESPHDSLAPAAIAIGQKCAGRFTVTNTDPHELFNLMRLSLMTGDTATMTAAINRRFTLATTAEARGNILLDAVEELLNSRPVHPDLAAALLVRMDSLGAGARYPRLYAHNLFFGRGTRNGDTLMIAREADALKTVTAQFTLAERRELPTEISKQTMAAIYITWLRHKPTLGADIDRLVTQEFIPSMRAEGIDENVVQAFAQRINGLASSVGTPAPPLALQHVFNAGSDKIKPAPGKVTLLVEVEKGSGLPDGRTSMLRRLHDKYASQGLDIVIIERTQGFSWSSPPQTPSDEAASDAWYYLDYLKLPFTLVVQETPFKHRPDGRLVPGNIPFEQQYMTRQILVGRDQKVFTQWIGFESETQLDMMVRMALAAKGSA